MKKFFDYFKKTWEDIMEKGDKTPVVEIVDDKHSTEKVDLPDPPKYEKIDVPSLSDEEIHDRATNSLESKKIASKKAIDDEISALENKLLAQKQDSNDTFNQNKQEVTKTYDDAIKSLSDDINKRGLARSSIAVKSNENLVGNKARAIEEITNAFTSKINSLNDELSGLEKKRQDAMNDFNISYTIALTEKINEIKDKLNKEKIDAQKYNNSIDEKMWKDSIEKEEKETDIHNKNLTNTDKEMDIEKRKESENNAYSKAYRLISEKLATLPNDEARDLIKNDEFIKKNLSSDEYYKLYDKYFK